MKKILIKLISFVLMIICGLSLFACTAFDDTGDENTSIHLIQTVSKNKTNEHSGLIESFAENVFDSLLKVYGYDESGSSSVENYEAFNFVYSKSVTFYTNSNESSKWIWSFSGKATLSEFSGKTFSDELSDDTFSWEKASQKYNTDEYKSLINNYKNCYIPAFKAVVYEIVLGKTPTVFNISKNPNSSTITIENKTASEYLDEVKQTYINTSSYIGLTQNDVDKVKAYISSNVIGSNAYLLSNTVKMLTPDNDTVEKTFEFPDRKYDEVLDKIMQDCYTLEFFAKPNSTYSSVSSSSYTATEIEGDDYPSAQYQSIILTSNSLIELDGLSFMIYGTQTFDVTICINIYNLKTGSKIQKLYDPMTIEANSVDAMIFVSNSDFNSDCFQIGKSVIPYFLGLNIDLSTTDNAIFSNMFKVTQNENLEFIGFNPENFINEENENYVFEICFDTKTNVDFRFGLFIMQKH